MKHHSTRARAYRHLLVSLPFLLAAGCTEPSSSDAPTAVTVPDGVNASRSVSDQLERLRDKIERFEDFHTATRAGYTQLTGCMVDPTAGGMGFHYAKADAFDGVVDPLKPKALLYEPQKHGKLKLVAVEFIVPYSIVAREAHAPRLFGQDFVHNDDFNIWMLHAWIFKKNPSGVFATWNPRVNCDAVPASEHMSHGNN